MSKNVIQTINDLLLSDCEENNIIASELYKIENIVTSIKFFSSGDGDGDGDGYGDGYGYGNGNGKKFIK